MCAMSDNEICPKCKNPKKSSSAGSLTQWIVACNCDAKKTVELAEYVPAVNLCRDCGKRIGEGRAGSFTQFVFRSDICRCAIPQPLKDALDNAPVITPQEVVEDDDAPELPLDPGTFPVDRYKPISQLGSGAAGAVYLAKDKFLNKRVAVKILHLLETKQLVAFQDEAKATSKLTHQCIVGVLDFGITDATVPYMVLTYVPGISLEELIKRDGSLKIETVQVIFAQICEALSYAHGNGVYHRDIKPSNILLIPAGQDVYHVRLIDFGIAKMQGRQEKTEAGQSRTLVGAPLYMSPDMGLGKPYDSRSEGYSLGCVMFEALTGRPPFLGENVYQTLNMHANKLPPKLCHISEKDFPDSVEALVATALEKDPDNRFQSMQEFRQAIIDIEPAAVETLAKLAETTVVSAPPKEKPNLFFLLVCACTAVCAAVILSTENRFHPKPTIVIEDKKEHKDAKPEELVLVDSEKEMKELMVDAKLSDQKKWDIDGREIHIYEANDEDFKTIDKIPAGPSPGIDVGIQSSATGTGFRYLTKFPLRNASIFTDAFNDDGAVELAKIKTLHRVVFKGKSELTARGLRTIAEGLPQLEHIALFGWVNLPMNAYKELAASKTLWSLDIGHSNPLTLDMLRDISKLKHLQLLSLTNTDFNDEGIEIVKTMPNLRKLEINQTAVTSKGLMSLVGMKQLNELTVGQLDGISPAKFKRFRELRPDVTVHVKKTMAPKDMMKMLPIDLNTLVK